MQQLSERWLVLSSYVLIDGLKSLDSGRESAGLDNADECAVEAHAGLEERGMRGYSFASLERGGRVHRVESIERERHDRTFCECNKNKVRRREGRELTCQNNQELILLEDIDLRYLEEGKNLDRFTSALSKVREINAVICSVSNLPSLVCQPGYLHGSQKGTRALTERRSTVDPVGTREEPLGEWDSFEHNTSFPQRILLLLNVVHPLLPPNLRWCPESDRIPSPAKVLERDRIPVSAVVRTDHHSGYRHRFREGALCSGSLCTHRCSYVVSCGGNKEFQRNWLQDKHN